MATQSTTWLVTGSSRGIGFEVVKQLASDPSKEIFATCRNPDSASTLKSLPGKLHVLMLDVDDEASIRNAAEAVSAILGDRGLDYLINNAGINPVWDHPFSAKLTDLQAAFTSNLAGPVLVSQAFVSLIAKSERKVLAHITSALASLAQLDDGTWNDTPVSYSISKAGLNMLMRKQAIERPDLIVVCIDPGWAKTDMGGEHAPLAVDKCASGIIQRLIEATKASSGKVWGWDGPQGLW